MWSIPVAGALAVSFTGATQAPEIQRPKQQSEAPESESRPELDAAPEPAPPSEPAGNPEPPVLPDPGSPPEPAPEPSASEAVPSSPASESSVPEMPPTSETRRSSSSTFDPIPPETAQSSSAPAPPAAPAARVLRPTDKRRFFSMSVGGSTPTGYTAAFGGMDFSWQMAIGSHSPRNPTFGGAFVLQQRKGYFNEISFVGRLLWDKPLSDSFALMSSTNFDFGVNVPIGQGSYLGLVATPSAVLGVGWGLKAILFERMLLGLRPISVNLIAPAPYSSVFVSFRWDVMATIGMVW